LLTLLHQERKSSPLEIGMGTGSAGKFFHDHGLEKVVCIDLSPEMEKLCQQKGLTSHVWTSARWNFPPVIRFCLRPDCLLHLPRIELPAVLETIPMALQPNSLFLLGVYGGYEHEGV